jgi:HlyD family secretion protein
MGKSGWKKWLGVGVVAAILAGAGVFAWRQLKPAGLPAGFAMGNRRIEATEIDIATKTAGRVKEILVQDGDFLKAGDLVARMDTQTLEADLHQAQAQARKAQQAKATASAVFAQRERAAEKFRAYRVKKSLRLNRDSREFSQIPLRRLISSALGH